MTHRSPVTFWLLLAATLSVDAVAVSWAYVATLPRTEGFYFGLACSELSLLCIWAYFSKTPFVWRWLVPLTFLVASVLLTTWLYNLGQMNWIYDSFDMGVVYLCLWLAQMSLLLAGLWFIRHTSFGQRWSRHGAAGRWQFSMKHVLAAMTLTPIAIVVLKESRIIQDIWLPFVAWTFNNALLAITAAAICTTRWHAMLRLAALAAIAALSAAVISLTMPGPSDSTAINLVQSAVLFVWLEFGQLIPRCASPTDAVAAYSPTKP